MRRRAVGNCLSPDLLWVLRVDFGMSASCPVRRGNLGNTCCAVLSVEGIGLDVIQAARPEP